LDDVQEKDCDTDDHVCYAIGGIGASDLPGNCIGSKNQGDDHQADKEMGRIFEDIAGIEEYKGKADKEACRSKDHQDRPCLAVALDDRYRRQRFGPACVPYFESEPALVEK